mmetsp:Transcript_348/g.477  ORF Transcript_348/g.477 Transcript_348/m.477 type:complete len:123 (-) Transcript_348:7-375(-)
MGVYRVYAACALHCISFASCSSFLSGSVDHSGICSGITDQCISRTNDICPSYGFPLHRGPDCLSAVKAGGCPDISTAHTCRALKLECDGCAGSGYPLPEQMCTNKCQDCAQLEDYHGMNCAR